MCFIVESTIEKSMKNFYVRPVKISSNYPPPKNKTFLYLPNIHLDIVFFFFGKLINL